MTTIEITDENFEEKILKSDKPSILKFQAEWCGQLPPSVKGRG